MCTNGKWLPRSFLIYTVVHEVTKILLIKDHAHKGKELFHVKNKEATCGMPFCGRLFQLNSKKMNSSLTNFRKPL